METISRDPDRIKGDLSLYSKEYGEAQGRGVAPEYLKILKEKFIDTKDKTVVELGSGSGSLMPFLKENFKTVFGMDINQHILRSNENKTGLVAGDLQDLPLASNSVDEVVSLHTFEHSPELNVALHEVNRILKLGGEAIIIVPNPQLHIRQLGALVDTMRMYTGSEKLLAAWKAAEGIGKVTAILNQFKLAWDVAGKLHVQNVTKESIEAAKTGMEITEVKLVYVPEESGKSWVITMKKK